jgi:ParB family chromosome partitioning protein
MAQVNEEWAWNLLLEFFNDADAELRKEAFQFATKKTKELGPLETALGSHHADTRLVAVEGLVKRHSQAAQAILARALEDADATVRITALDALADDDAMPQLLQALNSPHPDIRIGAATAVARHGNAAALAPLLAVVSTEPPLQKSQRKEWVERVKAALDGLCELGSSDALPPIIRHLNTKSAGIRKQAARALVSSAVPHHLDALRQAMQHSDPEVKYRAALGLAYAGDALVSSLVFSEEAASVLMAEARVLAAFALGAAGEDRLVAFLDDDNETLRTLALVLLLLREYKAHQGTPRHCLACLASRMPRIRLVAARALECFADPAAFLQHITELVNDRGEDRTWKVTAETLDSLAELLTHGAPMTRVHAGAVLFNLGEKEQAPFNWEWRIVQGRCAAEIKSLAEKAAERKPTPSQFTLPQLRQLAFGAYVGLIREQGDARVIRVRQTALSRAMALAKADKEYARACIPVFVQALGDPNQAVRMQAFQQLQEVGMDPAALGAEAIEAGHTDLGIKGLQLLTAGASASKAQSVLEEVMRSRTDDLAIEAAKLLIAQRGPVAVANQALEAASEKLRLQAVAWLAAQWDKDKSVAAHLRKALESRYQKVREAAALELATKKDTAAFDALVKLLATQDEARQRQAIAALVQLGDPRAPGVFLDRLENDPSGTALAEELLEATGSYRRPEVVDRLLSYMEKKFDTNGVMAFHAVRAIAGLNQDLPDPEDENPDKSWEKKQHPRRADLLAQLLERIVRLGDLGGIKQLIPEARWSRGKEAEPLLGQLVSHPDEELRHAAIEAVGWRARKRQGTVDPLLKALSHRDPVSQFLAAEGLARAGRPQGLSVLLSAIEFMTDLHYRQRAVAALGELADPRALDILLRLAGEEGHALQDAAAEAIGHLGKSEKAEQIFQLLERFAKGNGNATGNALRGLRWFNTVAGWQLIRKRATDSGCYFRETAIEMLGHNDDLATRDLLLKMLAAEDDPDLVEKTRQSAGRLFGEGSLEMDYALLQNAMIEDALEDPYSGLENLDAAKVLERVGEKGEARRIFEILPKCSDQVQQSLTTSLLNRATPPVAEAQAVLASNDAQSVRLAAQIVGRAGSAAGKAAGTALAGALEKWDKEWTQRRAAMAKSNEEDHQLTQQTTPCVASLIWVASRLGVVHDAILAAASARPDDPNYRPIRLAAVTALASGKLTEPVLKALETAALGNDAELRTLAADVIARHNAKRAAELAGDEKVLSDRVSFNRLASKPEVKVDATLRTAVGQLHYQGIVLPHLIARRDIDGLAAVLENTKLPEATRLGAIEGLAMLADEKAEAKIVQVAQVKKEELALRKAAWRALRRSKRARQKAKAKAQGTVS